VNLDPVPELDAKCLHIVERQRGSPDSQQPQPRKRIGQKQGAEGLEVDIAASQVEHLEGGERSWSHQSTQRQVIQTASAETEAPKS
jgi:hypothetical protein